MWSALLIERHVGILYDKAAAPIVCDERRGYPQFSWAAKSEKSSSTELKSTRVRWCWQATCRFRTPNPIQSLLQSLPVTSLSSNVSRRSLSSNYPQFDSTACSTSWLVVVLTLPLLASHPLGFESVALKGNAKVEELPSKARKPLELIQT